MPEAEPAADDENGGELGRIARILVLPAVPPVLLWEAVRAGGRAVSSGFRAAARAARRLLTTLAGPVASVLRRLSAGAHRAARLGLAIVIGPAQVRVPSTRRRRWVGAEAGPSTPSPRNRYFSAADR